jgi:hypothetical protein
LDVITQQASPVKEILTGPWNTEQAAEFLSISPETLRRLGLLEYRFSKADLIEYIDSRRNLRKSAIKVRS